jgi:WD40 repeat protein
MKKHIAKLFIIAISLSVFSFGCKKIKVPVVTFNDNLPIEAVIQVGHTLKENKASFSPDGKYVASNSSDCSVQVWDVETGKCVLVKNKLGYESGSQYVKNGKVVYKETHLVSDNSAIAFSSCGKHLAVSRVENIDIYDIKYKKIISSLKKRHNASVTSIAFAPYGKFLVSGSHDKSIKIWDFLSGKLIRTIKTSKEVLSIDY